MTVRMRNQYGIWGGPKEVFALWESFQEDPAVQEAFGLQENLQEGTGAPEGRADFPIFLQTVIRHRMRERFATVAAQWRSYMGIESAQDFREHTVSEMGGIYGMQPVREYDEYPRLFTDEAVGPSYAVAKHGGIYSVTFELVVNDQADLILNRTPREIGKMNAEYMGQVFIAFIESNPTYGPDGQPFFSGARGNEVTGSAADPTEDNLVTILETFTTRRNARGIPFTITPRRAIMRSPRQRLRLLQVIRSSQTIERSAAAAGSMAFSRGSDNPLSYADNGLLPGDAPILEPWLNDPNDWYLLGDAQDRPAFVAAFLRGRQEPFIGLRDPQTRNAMGAGMDPYGFEFDDIPFKIRSIFGAAPGEPLAAMRMRP